MRSYEPHYHQITAEGDFYSCYSMHTHTTTWYMLPSNQTWHIGIAMYMYHGLQGPWIAGCPHRTTTTQWQWNHGGNGAGSLVKPNFAPRADQTRHRQQEKWSEKGNFKGLHGNWLCRDRLMMYDVGAKPSMQWNAMWAGSLRLKK